MQRLGPALVLAGIILMVVGLIAWKGGLFWFGRLPGDIRIERDTFKVFIPITSMLLISVALTLLINLIRRFL